MESSREKSEESPPSTSAQGTSSSPSGSNATTSSTNIFNTASFLASGQSLFGTSTTSPYGHMPSAFSMFGTHPFQFGGLGMLGTPGSLSQTSGADWWRQASAHARTMAGMGAGFFPGLAMPPTFGSIGSSPASTGSDTKVAFSSPLFQSTLSSPGGSLSSPTLSTMSSSSGRGRGRGGRGRGRPKGSKNKATLLAEAAAANARANALAASMFISPPLVMEKPKEVSVIKKVEKEKHKEKLPKEDKGTKDNKESSSDSDSDISTGSDSEISSDSDDSDSSDSEGDEADKTKKLKEQLKQKEQELKREQEQIKQQQREALLRRQSPSQVIKSPPHSQSQGLLLPPKLSPVTTTSSDSKTEASPRPIRSPAKLAIKHSLQQKQREEQQKSLSPPVLTKISQEKTSQPKQLIQQSLMSTKPSEGLAQKLLSQQGLLQKLPSQQTQEQRAKEEEEKLKQLKLQFEQQIKQQQQLYKLQKRAQALSSPSSSSSTSAATNVTSKLLATSKSSAVSSTSASQSKIIHPQTFKLPSSSPSTSKGSDKKQKPLVARFRGVEEESSDSDSGDDSDDDDEDDSDSDDDDDDDDDSSETYESTATPTKSNETPSPTKSVKRAADVAIPNNFDDGGFRKRRRIIDLREVRIPLEHGWRRETRIRAIGPGGGIKGDVCYLAPCGKKLRTYPEVQRYLDRCGITDLTRENFSFSPKTNIGDFIECRNGANGTEYVLLTEEQILQRTRDGVRRGRPPSSEKLKKRDDRKVEQQEFARKAVEMRMKRKMEQQALVSAEMAKRVQEAKLRRKIERQAQVQAAKEAKRQQSMMAAEEKRRQKERIKLLKQQEKMQRLEQIRMEKEMKAQQLMEARKKRKELQDKQRLEEAMKKAKEREMRRQQQVMLKNQEKERRRQLLFMERERRKQHMMLVRALEARKKAEERERMKQEKKVEKKLTRERKMEQRRLELQIAKELKKPVEDMQLKEAKPLPILKRIPGMQLPGNAFADCMMVFEFLHNFGSVLDMDEKDIPTLDEMQQGLLGEEEAEREVLDMLANLLQCALRDPGVIPGMQSATVLRVPLHDADIDHRNLSEILRLFIQGRNGFQDEMSQRLETIPFQAHSPTQKAAILAFICNELLCSRAVVGEIDSSIEHMSNLRRDKWIVEGKLRKLRIIRAKKFHRPYSRQGMSNENSNMGEDSNMSGTMSVANTPGKASSKGDEDSKMEEDEEEDEDKDDDEEDGEGLDVEGEDEAEPESVEETDRRIEKLGKQQSQYRSKLFDASHSLRALCLGQDRYHRRYWVLPCAGGVFVEGMESAEPENMEVDKENSHPQESKDNVIPKETKENSTEVKDLKKEVKKEEEAVVKSENNVGTAKQNGDQTCGNHDSKAVEETKASAMSQGASENLFLQKPSKLSELLDVAKQDPDSCPTGTESRTSHDATAATSTPSLQQVRLGGLQAQKSGSGFLNIDTLVNRSDMKMLGTYMSPLPSSIQFAPGPLTADQLLKGLTHKMNGDGMWFSVLPRMPCDETSLTRLQLPSVGNVESSKTSPPGASQGAMVQNSAFSHPQVKSSQTGFGFTTFGQSPLGAQQINALYAQRMAGPSTSAYQPHFMGMAPNMWMGMNEVEAAPIPKEMVRGWWQMLESEQIRSLLKVLHPRGIRERILQKSLQKYNDYACQCCKKARENDAIKLEEVEDDKTPRDPSGAPLETWEEHESEELAYKFEVSLLQDVEDLEERVFQASLQVKGWKLPPRMTADYADKSIEEDSDLRPLELAQKRLASLEMNLERRYIKPPLSKNVQISLATMGFPEENSDSSTPPNSSDEDIPNALRVWRDVVTTETTAPQLFMCLGLLEKCIAWDKSIMKVFCQFCRKGDNEAQLLLCDGCDKGFHTYCVKPRMTGIPDGDWFCSVCVAAATGEECCVVCEKKVTVKAARCEHCPRVYHIQCLDPPLNKAPRGKWTCPECLKAGIKGRRNRKSKETKEKDAGNSLSDDCPSPMYVPDKKDKKAKNEASKDLAPCRTILPELEKHEDAWPFLVPVNTKQFPQYKKIIKRPMDLSTIKNKLRDNKYRSREEFAEDVRLICDNCETFNEDESAVGQAGHNMRACFETRWSELTADGGYR
ncbi:bromodomain adjacent to zinc finger domain protein 2B-like isoform X13 [Branchiostoma lanceolatum]|uniref:bromodomain adjacent to zinc finger domain protein 2B-like isoform X13 n=1 Tax=Branchiostoma lanceolatum TaxID=7740 RepID=UPI003454F3F8